MVRVFKKLKLHEPLRRVQFQLSENLTSGRSLKIFLEALEKAFFKVSVQTFCHGLT